MIRTFIVGVIAAIAGSKLKKAYDEGKLQPYLDKAKPYVDKAKPYVDEAIETAKERVADVRKSLGDKEEELTSPRKLAATSSKASKRL